MGIVRPDPAQRAPDVVGDGGGLGQLGEGRQAHALLLQKADRASPDLAVHDACREVERTALGAPSHRSPKPVANAAIVPVLSTGALPVSPQSWHSADLPRPPERARCPRPYLLRKPRSSRASSAAATISWRRAMPPSSRR